MILCPNCMHKEISGAIFCSECGAQLVGADKLVTQAIQTGDIVEAPGVKGAAPPKPPDFIVTESWVSLHLVESGQMLPLANRAEFTLGRSNEGQSIMPDVDLAPYRAYECGVSRLHAVLKRLGERAVIMDLGSSNGTYLNGERLAADVEHALTHGDLIALGKLKIQVLLRNV